MPAPHHSVFYRPHALPAAQPTASKHWGQSVAYINSELIVTGQQVYCTRLISIQADGDRNLVSISLYRSEVTRSAIVGIYASR